MSPNLLEQLAQQQVPAPPVKLRRNVQDRMNATLFALQIVDVALRVLPFALMHLAQAVAGLLCYTLTGDYEPRARTDTQRDPRQSL